MPVGDDQGLPLVDLEDHPRAEDLATQAREPETSLEEDVGPHGALQRGVERLDDRGIRRHLGELELGAGLRQHHRQEDHPAGDVDNPEQEAR